jgi:hypothetical protein
VVNHHFVVDASFFSHEQAITPFINNDAREPQILMLKFNLTFTSSHININDAYDFATFIFTPEHSSIETIKLSVDKLNLILPKSPSPPDQEQFARMSRMRRKVQDSLMEPITKQNFDRAITIDI